MTSTQLSNQEPYLTIHADGKITVSEKLQPSETAARVLECMKTQWMEDSQSKQIRELRERIKQLEDRIHRAAMAFFRDGSDGQVASSMLSILEEERGKP